MCNKKFQNATQETINYGFLWGRGLGSKVTLLIRTLYFVTIGNFFTGNVTTFRIS